VDLTTKTMEELIGGLRALAQRAATGYDVSAERVAYEAELKKRGIHVERSQRGGSRFAGQNPTREDLAQRLRDGEAQAENKSGGTGVIKAVDLLVAVKGAKAGDLAAQQLLASVARPFRSEEERSITGGALLIPDGAIPGYIAELAAANPIRALATEHDVKGRQVRLLIEGDDILVTEHVAEGATKPSSDASVIQTVSTIFKAAGVTDLADELIEDSGGTAEDMIAGNFARSIGRTVDVALLDGTGTGQPLGILRQPDVDHVTNADSSAMGVYSAIIRRITALKGRLLTGLTVVVHPTLAERFDLAVNGNDEFIFPDGLAGKLVGKATVVEDANLPVVAGKVPIIVGSFKRGLHLFSRKALTIEKSEGPGFEDDVTTFRAVERYGAAVVKPSSFEVVDGTDLTFP
jgi:HK97 family phage major capsid protein